MIRVLVVEDSPAVREFLVYLLSSDPELQVIGTAGDGEQAIDAARRMHPDVITMDIYMPRMNGLEATRRIMETQPTPIVIVSGSTDPEQVATAFQAVDAGALALLTRPAGLGHPDHQQSAQKLIQTVKLMSEVKVVRRWARPQREQARPLPSAQHIENAAVQIVAIGASTGGPAVLQAILGGLGADFPVPIVVVQHMACGFVTGFVEWLAKSSELIVRLGVDGERLLPGHAYVAPDDVQMKVARNGRLALTEAPAENGLRPSISHLFHSVAEVYGRHAVAILLTGMGRDGADALKEIHDKGALTIVQDAESSVVHGMPGEAIKLGAARFVLSPPRITAALREIAMSNVKA